MNLAMRAYGQAASLASSPREGEARALLKAAIMLQNALDAQPPSKALLKAALMNNRNLWVEIAVGVASAENELPVSVKNSILSIAQFIFLKTTTVEFKSGPECISDLIQINQNIALGLQGV